MRKRDARRDKPSKQKVSGQAHASCARGMSSKVFFLGNLSSLKDLENLRAQHNIELIFAAYSAYRVRAQLC